MCLRMLLLNQELTSEEKRAQLTRIIYSAELQNSPMLQKLLEFLAKSGTDGSASDITEWLIATTVFGRPKEFDAATDTTVRTSVYRLRAKLREYYAGNGKNDPIVVEIPKGHHIPIFTKRPLPDTHAETTVSPLAEAVTLPPARPAPRRMYPSLAARLLGVGALVFLAGLTIGRFWALKEISRTVSPANSGVIAQFWRAFAGSSHSVIVAYSNAELLQTDNRDLIRYDAGAIDDRGAVVDQALAARSAPNLQLLRGRSLFYEDGYTGTGEVQAVHTLTRLLTQLGLDISVKRVGLLTSDDFRTHNVVLLGSPLENRAIEDLHLRLGYAFEVPLHSMWGGRIVDRKSNSVSYTIERNPTTQVLQSDYAVVSVLPGVAPDGRIMILGGLTTSGTEGAAEFVSSEPSLSDLLQKANVRLAGHLTPFEGVVQVRVVRGLDPVSLKCVAARLAAK